MSGDLFIGFDPAKEGIGAHAWINVAGVAVGEDTTHIESLFVFDSPLLTSAEAAITIG